MKEKSAVYNGIIGTTVLRGVLALVVALHHANIFGIGYFPLMSGRSAVICFFVLSGWVMTWFFYSQGWSVQWPKAVNFYGRRLCRLGPVLLINFILVCFVMHKLMAWELVGLLPIWITPLPKFFNHILWTLVVEIEFYMVVPLVLLAYGHWRKPWMTHLFVYSILFIAPRAVSLFQQDGAANLDVRSFLGNACYFYAGVSFCAASLQGQSWFRNWGLKALVASMVAGWATAAVSYAYGGAFYQFLGVHAAVFGALVWIEWARRFLPRQFHQIPTLVKPLYGLGVISYGYYVFHGFCLGLVELNKLSWAGQVVTERSWQGFVVLVFVPGLMAWVTYWTVEKWVGNAYHKFSKFKNIQQVEQKHVV